MFDDKKTFYAFIRGPSDSPFEGGYFKVFVHLKEDYPFSPPYMKFMTKIYHPNISSQVERNSVSLAVDRSYLFGHSEGQMDGCHEYHHGPAVRGSAADCGRSRGSPSDAHLWNMTRRTIQWQSYIRRIGMSTTRRRRSGQRSMQQRQ